MSSKPNGGNPPRSQPTFLRSMLKSNFAPYMTRSKTVTYSEPAAPQNSRMQQYGHHHHSYHQQQQQQQQQPQRPVRVLKWSPYGDFIVAADERVLRVWNAERPSFKTSTELREGKGPGPGPGFGSGVNATAVAAGRQTGGATGGGAVSVAWSPVKHSELASLDADGTVKVWDFVSAKMVANVNLGPGEEGLSVVWKNDGEELVVATKQGSIKQISRHNMGVIKGTQVENPTSNLEFSATCEELLVGCKNGEVQIFDFPTMEKLHTIQATATSILALEISPYSRYLGVGGTDAILGLWDTQDWICVRSFAQSTTPIRTLSFTYDDTIVVAGSDEGGIYFNHAEMGDELYHLETNTGNPCVQWHPRYYALAYSSSTASGFKVVGNLAPF